jgi:hypothetical protein
MDEKVLSKALKAALAEVAPQVGDLYEDERTDPILGTEAKFSAALRSAFRSKGHIALSEVGLKNIGAFSFKSGQRSQSGNIDLLVGFERPDEPTECYGLELKCVGLPSKKGDGYNAAQIADDAMRILSSKPGGPIENVGSDRPAKFWGGWVVILCIEREDNFSPSSVELLNRFHSQMHKEYLGYKTDNESFVGRSKEAFQVAAFTYLGFSEPFNENLRDQGSYFSVKLEGSRVGAVAAWIGWDEHK